MSVQAALDFMGQIRKDESLSESVKNLNAEPGLRSIIDLAQTQGYMFSEEDLRQAFKHDWAMRWFSQTNSSE